MGPQIGIMIVVIIMVPTLFQVVMLAVSEKKRFEHMQKENGQIKDELHILRSAVGKN